MAITPNSAATELSTTPVITAMIVAEKMITVTPTCYFCHFHHCAPSAKPIAGARVKKRRWRLHYFCDFFTTFWFPARRR
jgi:hypothetical protein